ncbi:MAG: DUF368 domain-containing protein [Gammaproteobacteria bacterium]
MSIPPAAAHKIIAAVGIFVRGFAMGVADLIPGVSGGTVAFISGIYARLLAAVAVFSGAAVWRELLRLDIRAAFMRADGWFLLPLLIGILSAIAAFGGLLHYVLSHYAHLLLGFFFGMVLASAFAVAFRLRRLHIRHLFLAIVGGALAYLVVNAPVAGGFDGGLLFVFGGGAVAISAMLLPGISGSYLLLIMGLYETVLAAVGERDVVLLLVFAAGCGTGILLFARMLTWILNKWHDGVIAFLIGVMLGALPKIWPWKEHAEGAKIILQNNVAPSAFGGDAQVVAVLLLALMGALMVAVLHKMTKPAGK